MYDIPRHRPTNKETAVAILIVTVLLVVIFCAGYLFGIQNAGTGTGGENIYDNGNPAAGIRNEITNAGSGIVSAESGINHAADTAGRIENRIEAAQGRVEYIKTTAAESQRIIKECQSILAEVRRRGKENPVKN